MVVTLLLFRTFVFYVPVFYMPNAVVTQLSNCLYHSGGTVYT